MTSVVSRIGIASTRSGSSTVAVVVPATVQLEASPSAARVKPSSWLPEGPCLAEVAGRTATLRAGHYAEIPDGEAAMIPGSLGTVELSLRGDDLARRWSVERGASVRITRVRADHVGMTER